VNVRWQAFTSDGFLSAVSGRLANGNKTAEHIGFAVRNGDLVGTVADGGTRDTTTLVSGVSTGRSDQLQASLDATTPEVTFSVNGIEQGSTQSNIPSGTSDAATFSFLAENADSGGSNNELRTGEIYQVQMP